MPQNNQRTAMILQTLIKSFIAIIIIGFVIWNRFFRNRANISSNFLLPIELILISNTCLVIFFGCIMYINIKKQTFFQKRVVNSVIIKKVLYLIQEFIFKTPEFLYNKLTKNVNLKPILETPGSYFTAYCYYPRIIVIGFLKVPLILVATTFLIDKLFFETLTYFFKSLIFLIPLLIMKVWLFILENYSTRRLDHLAQFLIVTRDPQNSRFIITLKPDNQLPIFDDFTKPQIKDKFNVLCDLWDIYSQIYSFLKQIDHYRNSYHLYIQFYTSCCFFIGWSIQLYNKLYIYLL